MATSYSTLLGLALPVQGELSGTWGDTVNNYITNYLDAAVAGTQTLSTDADVTLTKTTGTSLGATSSQYAVLNCTGARTAQRTITAPAASKMYTVINATTGGFAVKLVGAGPTTGITIAAGEKCFVVWTGSDFAKVTSQGVPGDFTTISASGTISAAANITFTGTGNRITGDFSNATVANRVMFQTSTVNGNTSVATIPNGTGTTTSFIAFNAADTTNASFAQLINLNTEVAVRSDRTGTGTYLPMTFYTGGSERFRFDTGGAIGIAGANYGTAGQFLTTGGAGASPSWSSALPTTATISGFAVGYKEVPQNAQAAGYTAVLADSGKHIYASSAGTFTIPANASVAYPVGTVLTFINMNASACTIAITTDTMYLAGQGTTGSRTLAQYGMATAIKMTSTTWMISGSGLT